MAAEELADKILRIRNRLAEIEKERADSAANDFAKKAELLDEQHTLEARLGELQDEAAREGVGIAQKEAGAASDYESVPDVPDETEASPEARPR